MREKEVVVVVGEEGEEEGEEEEEEGDFVLVAQIVFREIGGKNHAYGTRMIRFILAISHLHTREV